MCVIVTVLFNVLSLLTPSCFYFHLLGTLLVLDMFLGIEIHFLAGLCALLRKMTKHRSG